MDQRVFGAGLVHQKGDDEHAAGKQEPGHHPGIEPVEPVALIEAGIDEAEADTRIDDAGPIGPPQQIAVDRPVRHRDGGEQHHHRRQRRVLPEDPFPMPGLRIPPLDRAGDILRKDEAERVGGDAPDPPLRGQAAQDEAECRGNEGADREPADELQRDQRVVIMHEGRRQRGQRQRSRQSTAARGGC